jgi:hypothetical protein
MSNHRLSDLLDYGKGLSVHKTSESKASRDVTLFFQRLYDVEYGSDWLVFGSSARALIAGYLMAMQNNYVGEPLRVNTDLHSAPLLQLVESLPGVEHTTHYPHLLLTSTYTSTDIKQLIDCSYNLPGLSNFDVNTKADIVFSFNVIKKGIGAVIAIRDPSLRSMVKHYVNSTVNGFYNHNVMAAICKNQLLLEHKMMDLHKTMQRRLADVNRLGLEVQNYNILIQCAPNALLPVIAMHSELLGYTSGRARISMLVPEYCWEHFMIAITKLA